MAIDVAQQLREALARFEGGKLRAKESDNFTAPNTCAVLALPDDDELLAEAALAKVVNEQYPDRLTGPREYTSEITGAIITFNDHPDTTFDDVRAVFEKAIANAEAEL